MEEKFALLNCLKLIYLDDILDSGDHFNLINQTLKNIKTSEWVTEDDANSSIVGIRSVVKDLVSGSTSFEMTTVLQRIHVYCSFDENLYVAIKEALTTIDRDDERQCKEAIGSCVSQLQRFNCDVELRSAISSASYEMNNKRDVNVDEWRNKLLEALEQSRTGGVDNKFPSRVDKVSTDEPDKIASIIDEANANLNGATYKTGWKDINKMMGIHKGIVPGELWLMPALPHNAKTLFSLLMFISIGIFNDPKDFVTEGKKPLLLDLTLENELGQNLPMVYRTLYEFFEKKTVDVENINSAEAGDYIRTKLSELGWTFVFERHINTDFTVDTLRSLVEEYEAQGYQVMGIRGDYFGTCNSSGLGNGTTGSDKRELYRRIRNITTPRKIFVLAPHQLSPKAKELKAIDPYKYVKALPGKGFYDGCTTIDNEADGELYFGITDDFLEVQRGKHRTMLKDTPESLRYVALPFNCPNLFGVLPWDVDSEYKVGVKSVQRESMNLFG